MIPTDEFYVIGTLREDTKRYHNVDYILCVVYFIISMVNAVSGVSSMAIFAGIGGMFAPQGIETSLLLMINFIVMARTNLKLVILKSDKTKTVKEELEGENSLIKIKVHAIDQRMQILVYAYLIETVILIMNIIYKSPIEDSLSMLVFIPVILTTYNEMIDIWKYKYNVQERITFEYDRIQ